MATGKFIPSNLFADDIRGCRQHCTFPGYLPRISPALGRAYGQAERSCLESRGRGNRGCRSCE